MELPLFLVGAISQPKTMKIKGEIEDVPMIIMVDSGASHNFIAKDLVERLGLPVEPTFAFAVCLGNGVKER